jgi:arylsulfatase
MTNHSPHRLTVTWLALPLLALVACVAPDGSRRPPNIVLILADDLGYGELGSYGQRLIQTPHLDQLAARGMRFTQHYSGSPVCAPSRCTILTGLHTGHAFIRDNDEMRERGDVWNDPALEGQRPLPADTTTLGHSFQQAGYSTAFVGKWGLGWTGSSGDPNAQGFDHFYGYNCQRVAHNYYPTFLWDDGRQVPLDNPSFSPRQRLPDDADPLDPASYEAYQGNDYAPDFMIEDALRFVRNQGDNPFLLTFATPVPHLALQVPEDSLQQYAEAFDDRPYLGQAGYLPHRLPRAAYAAMISRMDRDVGRLLALIDELGLTDDTLVLFTSDNGPSWVGGVDREYFDSSGGLRGRKAQVYEGGLRVPLIVAWPDHVQNGSTSDHVSAFWDLMPTLLDAAGVPVPDGLDGKSFLPTLMGESDKQQQHAALYWEHARRHQAVRMGDWKGVRHRLTDPLELYDLSADPEEAHDVASLHPSIVLRIEALMTSMHTPSQHFPLVGE